MCMGTLYLCMHLGLNLNPSQLWSWFKIDPNITNGLGTQFSIQMFILIGLVRIMDTSNSKKSTKIPRMGYINSQKKTVPSVFIDSADWSPQKKWVAFLRRFFSPGSQRWQNLHALPSSVTGHGPCVTGGTKNGDFLMGKPLLLPLIYIYIHIY